MTSEVIPYFYPMRPINGGRLDHASDKGDGWVYDIKINGWRGLVSPVAKQLWNRHGKRLSIEDKFLHLLPELPQVDWLDCEPLERRGTGKGILVVLDAPTAEGGLMQRRAVFDHLPVLPLSGKTPGGVYKLPPPMTEEEARHFWVEWDVPDTTESRLVEGLVAKRLDALYIRQRISPSKETFKWVKHRFSTQP
jgi:hypothetical protein